jgi:hypothetical protein
MLQSSYSGINKENTMFVYIWRDAKNIPFYVGFTNSTRRTNPQNSTKRNWLCEQKLNEIGRDHVVVELRFVDSIITGQELERKLIQEYGRIQTGTGPLTNLMPGGEGANKMPEEVKALRRQAMLDPNNPIRSPEAVKKRNLAIKKRMNSLQVKEAMSGEANIAKLPKVRAKLKAVWQDPEYRAERIAERTGSHPNFSQEVRVEMSKRLRSNPGMKGWGERNGKDPEFDAKRIAGIKAAQPKRLATMADPEAKARRVAALKATMNSAEFKANRTKWDTPEYRKKLSDNKKAYWAAKRMEKLIGT